jgi:hypothetical protein
MIGTRIQRMSKHLALQSLSLFYYVSSFFLDKAISLLCDIAVKTKRQANPITSERVAIFISGLRGTFPLAPAGGA